MAERLWDDRLTQLGVSVLDAETDREYWHLKAAWLTVNGSWNEVPDWARKWQLDTLGGDHHVFGRCLDKQGNVLPSAGFMLGWPDGYDVRVPEADGWANLPIEAGYNWQETAGPYYWHKVGNADVLDGVGLPYPPLPWEPTWMYDALGGVHVSFFGVWQEADPIVEPEPEPSGCLLSLAGFLERLAAWLKSL